MAKKKKKRHIPLQVLIALEVFLFTLIPFVDYWREIGAYFAFQQGKTETVTSQCLSVTVEKPDGIHRNSYKIFVLHLKSGRTLAVYADALDDSLFRTQTISQNQEMLEERFVTGEPITFTYVTEPAQKGDTCALISATANGAVLLEEDAGISQYAERITRLLVVAGILWSFALLCLLAPLLWRLHEKHLARKKRRKKLAWKAKRAQKAIEKAKKDGEIG